MKTGILTTINGFVKKSLIELSGILLLFVSIFLLTSILSYSPDDPNFIYTPEEANIKNVLIDMLIV